jgi:uncharacterized membrane protein SpoIIM required for sporulation
MNLEGFLTDRTPSWETFEGLLKRARGRPERLGPDGVLQLGQLYRATVADLALARLRYPGDPVLDRLERLAAEGRTAIYRPQAVRGSVRRFFAREYWRELRARPLILSVAIAFLLGPTLLAAGWAANDPGAAIGLVPSSFRAAADPHLRHLPEGAATQAGLASSIFTNNIQVTFLAFAGGIALGLGTLLALAYNGVLLGTLAGLTAQAGTFSVFVRYVVPHGLLELSCIAVAGSAGLRLGWSLVDAGTLSRGESLQREARRAVALVLGTAPWLVVAGCVEGFVTPDGLSLPAALAVGISLAALYWSLVLTRGRRRRSEARASLGPQVGV